jgi:SAM-dependent methyltransferase
MNENEQPEFWESSFISKQEMWGLFPARSAILTNHLFIQKGLKDILIPGIGYGRNAQIFRDNGMEVTGIEISQTAIELLRKHYGEGMTIYHGSVTAMPFDHKRYDGIFCYGLIYLLDKTERAKLIRDCYEQLSENGWMVFTVVSKTAPTYGTGKQIGKDRFEQFGGVNIFFYDRDSIREEFEAFGLVEITEIEENMPFYMITCKKTL